MAAGWTVVGYDIDPAAVEAHRARGGVCVGNPAELAATADVVVTSLPSRQALLDVALGPHGLGTSASAGLTVVETSTLPLEAKEQARGALADRGAYLLDCTLSGTGAQAKSKDLVAYVSGAQPGKDRAAELLRAITRRQLDVGAFGNGTKIKMIANLLVAVHNVAAAEALVLAEGAGLDPQAVVDAVSAGAGSSRMLEIRGSAMAAGRYSGPGMRTSLFAKDLDLISAFARDARTPVPLFTLATTFYQAALSQDRGNEDTACVHAVLKNLAGQVPQ
jgi:3-hydroxyisobutyrate dehydrogenase-like beta-hydroxyacid dehydrogenase